MHSNDQLFIITSDDFVIFEIRAHWGGVGGSIYIELRPSEHCHYEFRLKQVQLMKINSARFQIENTKRHGHRQNKPADLDLLYLQK